jgi:hypothetical protein
MRRPNLAKGEPILQNPTIVPTDEFVGAVVKDSVTRYFYNILSMWILDYSSYHPQYDPDNPKFGTGGWRKGLLTVDLLTADAYINLLALQEIDQKSLKTTISEFGNTVEIVFVVDFDKKLFVNGWHDNIAIHEYVPMGWQGIEDDPNLYIPK